MVILLSEVVGMVGELVHRGLVVCQFSFLVVVLPSSPFRCFQGLHPGLWHVKHLFSFTRCLFSFGERLIWSTSIASRSRVGFFFQKGAHFCGELQGMMLSSLLLISQSHTMFL